MKFYLFRNSDRLRLGPYRAEVLDLLFEILPPAFRSDFQYCDSVQKKWSPFLTYQPQNLRADAPPPAPTEALAIQPASPRSGDPDSGVSSRSIKESSRSGVSDQSKPGVGSLPRFELTASRVRPLSMAESAKAADAANSDETEAHVSSARGSQSQISQISNLSKSTPQQTGLTGSKGGADRRRDDRVKYQQPVVLIDGLREFVTTTVDVSISGFRIEDPLPGDFPKVVRVQMDVLDLGLVELEAELVQSAREARDRFRVIGQSSRLGIEDLFNLIRKSA